MCLGVPGRIVSIAGDGLDRRAEVDFSGARRTVSLAYLPEAVIGDFVIVHVGLALTRLDAAQAQETLGLLASVQAGSG